MFGTFWLLEIADDDNASFLSDLRKLSLSGLGQYMAMRVGQIGTIPCPLSNIPSISAHCAKATTFLIVW